MKFDPEIHHRRSLRLKGYDYTRPGAYFITLVSFQRDEIFGEVVDGEMKLSSLGQVAQEEWFKTAKLRSYVQLFEDEFVVMPNHAHGIIWLAGDADVGARRRRAPTSAPCPTVEKFGAPVSGSIPTIVRAYKSAVTYAINRAQNTRGAPIWQRNYYEHIARNEAEINRFWDYIDNNPRKWDEDQLHPCAKPNQFNQE
ncbi:MAG: transposase [Chloroflexota bacterium]